MTLVLLLSILLRVTATIIAIAIVIRHRDWLLTFLPLMFGLMTLREVLLWWETERSLLAIHVPALAVSVLMVVAAFFLERILSKRKQREENVRKSEIQLAAAQRISHLGSWEWDIRRNKVTWSDELYRIFGLKKKEFEATYEAYMHRVHPDDRQFVEEEIRRAVEQKVPFNHFQRILRPTGEVRIIASRGQVSVDEAGEVLSLFGACLDCTEAKIAEDELKASREQLRRLSASLHSAREKERARVAREVHDELGQMLTALKMDVSLLAESVAEGAEMSAILQDIRSINKLVNDSIKTVQTIASNLRPSLIDHMGLIAAMESHAHKFQSRTGIRCVVRSDLSDGGLDHERSLAIFRIFQETLTNVARHARATEVDVCLVRSEANMIMAVRDDGCGISDGHLSNKGSMGIVGMKERAFFLGGELHIRKSGGRGTEVVLEIPFIAPAIAGESSPDNFLS